MSRARLVALLLLPSSFSLVAAVVGAACVFALSSWAYVTGTLLVSHELFGGQSAVLDLLAAGPLVYNAVIVAGSLLVGLGVYALLLGIHHFVTRTRVEWRAVFHADPRVKVALETELGIRLFMRIIGVVAWMAYALIFAKVIAPMSIFALQISLDQLQDPTQWQYGFFGFVLFATGLHIHVVFARLVALRPRLFGGEAAVSSLFTP